MRERLERIVDEAVRADVDQLVMVSRPDASKIYLLTKGRITKGIAFETDVTAAFVEYFSEMPEHQSEVQFELNLAASSDAGNCYTVKISRV
jgi:hypothetical protein